MKLLLIFFHLLAFQPCFGSNIFDEFALLEDGISIAPEQYVESHLLDCQKSQLRAEARGGYNKYQRLLQDQATKRYAGNLTRADLEFIAKWPRLAVKTLHFSELATNFVELVCSNFVHNDSETDIYQHVAITLLASVNWGKERACEWSTSHEMKNVDSLSDEEEDGNILVIPRSNDYLRLGPAERMDLNSNKAAMMLFERYPDLVRDCVLEITLRKSVRRTHYFGINYQYWITDRENEKFETLANHMGVLGSCRKVHALLQQKEYNLFYIRKGESINCNA